jgi:MoaA/NifB/PqqE/SkfB family radical SAM enzyme
MLLNLLAQLGRNPALAAAWQRIGRLPEPRIGLLLDIYHSLPRQSSSGVTSGFMKNLTDNLNSLEWLLRIAERLSDASLRAFVGNLIVREMALGQRTRREFLAREGFEAPVTIVLNPTMACNLRCTGCYSFKMPRKGMDYALLQKILREARAMGTHFITVSGGEPFVYRHYFRMVEEFSDLQFMTYTNATLIDEEVADRIAAAGNVMPAISVEGFGAQTDRRRGAGVHEQVLRAMSLLRERGVMFGFSATPTRQNSDIIASDDFIDYYLEKGVLFGWLFQYLPVGKDPDLALMATPAQREALRARTKEWQVSKPLFIGDFWNDGACVGGCLSATRYCYITPEGKVQPCTFVHFYTHDLHEHSLLDVFRSKFFRAIRGQQPYSRNLLRPCKIIDNPEVLREVVRECGAKPSYEGAETIVEDAAVRAHLDSYAKEWARIADRVWQGPQYQGGDSVLVPFLGRINANEHFYILRKSAAERQRIELEATGGAPPARAATRATGERPERH